MNENFFGPLEISASALSAERTRVAVISRNIANASSLAANPGAEPYRRQTVVFETVMERALGLGDGPAAGSVRVREIASDPTSFRRVHRPGHPGADETGWVNQTNVEVALEMVDLMDASRSYQSNLTALKMFRQMAQQTLAITR